MDEEEEDGPVYSLDAYENQLRNTVYAAYEDHDETDIHERLESLLFEFREDYDPHVDSPAVLEAELDALVRDAYIPADQVIDVLRAKIDELEQLGTADSEVDRLIEEAPDPQGPPEEGGPVDELLEDDS